MKKSTEITRQEILEHDRRNDELGKRFVRALAVERAALDFRLDPACIRVLAAISYFMNASIQRAWPSYHQIGEITGYSAITIEHALRRLKDAGYIFSERCSPITGGRALVHYGLAHAPIALLNDVVTAAVQEYRARLEGGTLLTHQKTIGSEGLRAAYEMELSKSLKNDDKT